MGDVEKSFYSIDGDIDALTTVVRKWLIANDRLASQKFIVGESYGGFRAPKLARKLASKGRRRHRRDRDDLAGPGLLLVLLRRQSRRASQPFPLAGRGGEGASAARDPRGASPGGRELRGGAPISSICTEGFGTLPRSSG